MTISPAAALTLVSALVAVPHARPEGGFRAERSHFTDASFRAKSLAQVLDGYTPADPGEAGWVGLTSQDISRIFAQANAESVAGIDSSSVIPNPEPSSLAVWVALCCGALAMAHAVRHRRAPAAV